MVGFGTAAARAADVAPAGTMATSSASRAAAATAAMVAGRRRDRPVRFSRCMWAPWSRRENRSRRYDHLDLLACVGRLRWRRSSHLTHASARTRAYCRRNPYRRRGYEHDKAARHHRPDPRPVDDIAELGG